MLQKNNLCRAITAAVTFSAYGIANGNGLEIFEEVVVTATKRAQSAQDIPVAVQALSGESLNDLNVGNFDDYIRYLPNVTAGGRGPGQSSIYIRGMATDTIAVQLAGANGSVPNVALYLDEQPVSVGGRNLDVYVTDMERIEVLAGPQGTLFGASSQAGTVRLITNKPKMNELEIGLKTSVSNTHQGEMSNSAEGFFNLPLIADKLAVRAAFYNVREGGYIDNVPGSKQIPLSNPGFGPGDNPVRETAFNTDFVESDFNDSYYQGVRVGILYDLNDNWSLLVQHTQQTLGADGVFDYDPAVGDLEVQRYFEDELEDTFGQTSWTLEGRLAALEVIYTGGYLDREVEQTMDYTGYSNTGPFIPYYICEYPGYATCSAPVLGFQGEINNQRQTHEVRIATPAENRLRAVAGIFYEDIEVLDLGNFIYTGTIDQGFAPNAPLPDATTIDSSTRLPGVAFFNDITRTEEQIAVFGELTYDLIPELLTATLGLRYYDMKVDLNGSSNFANRGVDGDSGRNLDTNLADVSPLSTQDTIGKVNLTYTPGNDLLFYVTYSEGFRPGGFNRGGGDTRNGVDIVPKSFETDTVENYEFGWKTRLLDGTLQFNGSMYYIDWSDIQVSRFDPVNLSILTFIDNAASAEIRGVESDIIWAATDNLTFFLAMSYNDSELTETPPGIIDLAPEGSELALTPSLQGNIRTRYEWELGDHSAYWQLGVQSVSSSYSSIVAEERFKQDAYITADASLGLSNGSWGMELFVENLTDERADLFINTQDEVLRTTTNRPRTIGLRFSYSLSDML